MPEMKLPEVAIEPLSSDTWDEHLKNEKENHCVGGGGGAGRESWPSAGGGGATLQLHTLSVLKNCRQRRGLIGACQEAKGEGSTHDHKKGPPGVPRRRSVFMGVGARACVRVCV